MPSSNASKTIRANNQVPSPRERLAAQFGQINDLVSADWSSGSGTPDDIKEAINRLAAAFVDLLAKLDADAGVADTDYASTLKP